jgi:hypothetical protein
MLAVVVVPRVTLVGENAQLHTAVDGETEADSVIEPVKPFRLENVRVVGLASPATVVRLLGLALRVKPWMV